MVNFWVRMNRVAPTLTESEREAQMQARAASVTSTCCDNPSASTPSSPERGRHCVSTPRAALQSGGSLQKASREAKKADKKRLKQAKKDARKEARAMFRCAS